MRSKTLTIVGSLIALVALGLLVASVVLMAFAARNRTVGDYLTTDPVAVATDRHALTWEQLDFGWLRNDWLPAEWMATISVNVSPRGDAPIFVGIAPESAVRAYLGDVSFTEVVEVSDGAAIYASSNGEMLPALPSEQNFWVATSEGTGSQTLGWDIEPGEWTVLVMNADATPEISVDVSVGAKTPWLTVVIVLLAVGGLLLGGVAGLTLIFGLRRRPPGAPEPGTRIASDMSSALSGRESDTP